MSAENGRSGIGKLFCVGVGPGDPELITLKAKKVVEESDVVFAPVKSVHSESFALEVIKKVVDLSGKEVITLIFPMTTRVEKAKPYWEKAWQKIKEKIYEGKKCVFVVEGDPLIYSTFNSILEIAKKEEFPFEIHIVPGISSFQILPAKLKTPVADGDEIIVIMPASLRESSGCRTATLREDFQDILKLASSLFVLKAGRVLKDIYNSINQNGEEFSAFFGELCGTEKEFITELTPQIFERENHYFSLVFLKKQTKAQKEDIGKGEKR